MFKKKFIKGILSALIIGAFQYAVPNMSASLNNAEKVYAAAKKVVRCTTEKLRIRTEAGTDFAQLTLGGEAVYLLLNEKATVKGEKKSCKWAEMV